MRVYLKQLFVLLPSASLLTALLITAGSSVPAGATASLVQPVGQVSSLDAAHLPANVCSLLEQNVTHDLGDIVEEVGNLLTNDDVSWAKLGLATMLTTAHFTLCKGKAVPTLKLIKNSIGQRPRTTSNPAVGMVYLPVVQLTSSSYVGDSRFSVQMQATWIATPTIHTVDYRLVTTYAGTATPVQRLQILPGHRYETFQTLTVGDNAYQQIEIRNDANLVEPWVCSQEFYVTQTGQLYIHFASPTPCPQ